VIVVDLRPGDGESLRASRALLIDELGEVQGIRMRTDAGLDGALAGEASDTDAPLVRAALAEARAAFGDVDCKKATIASDRAIDLLAARQASGIDDGTALRGAWAIVLLCADQAGARARAQNAADHLRALGVATGDQAGISEATWERFPEIDARVEGTDVALTVTTVPAGATVWIDHVQVGASPVTVHVAPGEHLVAAGEHAKRGAARVEIDGQPLAVELALEDRTGSHSAIATIVKEWRDGGLTPTAEALGTIMESLEVRFALVLSGKNTVQVWARGPRDDKPRKVDDAARSDIMGIGALINDRVAAWDANAPDPDLPLLRETDDDRKKGPPEKWWIYAAIVGTVAVLSTVLYVSDSADDHQRIVLRF
jgi:hypothetical protein